MISMTYDLCVQRIYQYLNKEDHSVRILNLMTSDEIKHFKQRFGVSAYIRWDVSDFCVKSDLPEMDKFWNDLKNVPDEKPIIIYGFTSLLKLFGNESIIRFLSDFLSLSRSGKTILVSFQGQYWLKEIRSPKLQRLIYSTTGNTTPYPEVTFRSPELAKKSGNAEIFGLRNLARHMEESTAEQFIIVTDRKTSDFPNSLLLLKDENNFYDAVTNIDPVLQTIPESFADDDFWKHLLSDLEMNGKSVQKFVDNSIGTTGNLAISMGHWNSFDSYQRKIYFLAMKLYGVNNNWSLKTAVEKTDTPNDLVREIYRSIQSLNPYDKNYWRDYDIRRKILGSFNPENHDAQDFVLHIRSCGKEGLYFLSDSSVFEKEMVFEILDRYGDEFEFDELKNILRHVYPELLAYLDDYPLNNNLYNSYFRMYKYQKVINRLLPEFEEIVEDQAIKHDFIMLPTRSEIIAQQDYDKSEVYFMDAMGTESLGYLAAWCRDLELQMLVKLCKAELPSDTIHNKGFVTELRNDGVTVYENDELDHLKHGKNKTYDYSVSKLPLYLIEEFKILSTVMRQVSKKLSGNEIQKIYLIPDHGSSRMAMIKNDPKTVEMETSGDHGGRNCSYHDGMPKMEKAIIENGKYSMTNYDRFKGGRFSGVELHGGAAIEEVVIPFVTIQLKGINYEIELLTPVLTISFKDKGTIRISSNVYLDQVQIRLNGELFDALPDGINTFKVPLQVKLKTDKDYSFDVLTNGNEIKSGLTFHVQSKMGKERDMFG